MPRRTVATHTQDIPRPVWRGHAGKVPFPSKRIALARAKLLWIKGEAYKCAVCHRWHISKRRSARTPRAGD